jgi:hypothetical protein
MGTTNRLILLLIIREAEIKEKTENIFVADKM